MESVSISESFSQSIGTMFGMGNLPNIHGQSARNGTGSFLVQLGLYPCRNSFAHASMDSKSVGTCSGTSACTHTFKFV